MKKGGKMQEKKQNQIGLILTIILSSALLLLIVLSFLFYDQISLFLITNLSFSNFTALHLIICSVSTLVFILINFEYKMLKESPVAYVLFFIFCVLISLVFQSFPERNGSIEIGEAIIFLFKVIIFIPIIYFFFSAIFGVVFRMIHPYISFAVLVFLMLFINFIFGSNPTGYTSSLIINKAEQNTNNPEQYCSYVHETETNITQGLLDCYRQYIDSNISILDEKKCEEFSNGINYFDKNYCFSKLQEYNNKKLQNQNEPAPVLFLPIKK